MNICSAKNCYLITKSLYSKNPIQNPYFSSVNCNYCNEMSYCCQKCRDLDWEFFHKFKCFSRKTKSKKTLEDYKTIKDTNEDDIILGQGALGVVKLVKELQTNRYFALKIISKKLLFKHHMVENLKRETRIQKRLNHPNIIKLYSYFEDKDNVYLVLEYAKQKSLANKIHVPNVKPFSEKEAYVYFIQTALGLDYLHKQGVLHRDLKPENLLLDNNGDIKLCDFGWSIDETITMRNTICGTLEYMAPEIMDLNSNKYYNEEIDIWSLGIILYELLHGHLPDKKKIIIDEKISEDAQYLINELLKYNPKERITLDNVFECSWIKKYQIIYKLDIQELRQKYSDPNNIKERSTKTGTEDSIIENEFFDNKDKIGNSPHKNNSKRQKSIALTKKEFNEMIKTQESLLENFNEEIEKQPLKTLSKRNTNIRLLLEENSKTTLEKTFNKQNKKQEESSIIDSFFKMIGCLKKK